MNGTKLSGVGEKPVIKYRSPARNFALVKDNWLYFWFGIHIVLGVVLNASAALATIHAVTTLIIALIFLFNDRGVSRVLCAAAYIAGAEILWRMTGAAVFWEYGKYAVSLILLLVLIKWRIKPALFPIAYFGLLLPAAVITFFTVDLFVARDTVSFNLSGPLALSVTALVTNRVRFDRRSLYRLVVSLCAPVLSILTIALWSTISATEINFTDESNFTTSGGYGPNQVSAVLSLAALLCWLVLILFPKKHIPRWLFLGLLFLFIGQSALTFSRGGPFNFLLAASVPTLLLLKARQRRVSGILLVMFAVSFIAIFLFPSLNRFTGLAMEERLTNRDLTGRDVLARADLRTFLEHPVFGVGVGQSSYYHSSGYGGLVAAHTEYTRVLAEHGILGVISFGLLLASLARSLIKNRRLLARGTVLMFSLWALAEMGHAAMRISLISLILGLALAKFDLDDDGPAPV